MMRQFDDPDQAVSWAAILLFLNSAFDGARLLAAVFRDPQVLATVGGVLLLLALAGKVAGGAGILKQKRWGWPVAVAATGLSLLLDIFGLPATIFSVLIYGLVLYLLFRPAVRERFGRR
jgi:uncharacterized membrane protein (DUF2068 family)